MSYSGDNGLDQFGYLLETRTRSISIIGPAKVDAKTISMVYLMERVGGAIQRMV